MFLSFSSTGFPLSEKSWNVLEMKKHVLESCKMSWKLMNFRKLRFYWNWNDNCCSISLKFEIPSTFFRQNVLEINSKNSWKVLEMIQDIWVLQITYVELQGILQLYTILITLQCKFEVFAACFFCSDITILGQRSIVGWIHKE